jgi:hypothetical protein
VLGWYVEYSFLVYFGNDIYLTVLLGISFILTQVVERRGDRDGALALFNEAVRICPTNALVRYRRAKINIATRKYLVSQFASF